MKKPLSQFGIVSAYLFIFPILSICYTFLLDGVLRNTSTACRIPVYVLTGLLGPLFGLIYGIRGLLEKSSRNGLPLAGTIIHSCWLLLAAGLIGLEIWFSTGHW